VFFLGNDVLLNAVYLITSHFFIIKIRNILTGCYSTYAYIGCITL